MSKVSKTRVGSACGGMIDTDTEVETKYKAQPWKLEKRECYGYQEQHETGEKSDAD